MKKITAFGLSLIFLLLLSLSEVTTANAASLSNDAIAIREVLQQFVTGWNEQDANKLAATWDLDYDRTTYIPVESQDIIQGGNNIAAYYQDAVPYIASVKLSTPIIDVMGDYAQAVAKTDFEVNNEDGSTYSEPLRVNFTLEKKGDRWLTIHYAESATIE